MATAAEIIAEGRQARNDGDFAGARARYATAANMYRDQNDVLAYAHTIRHVADIYQQESNFAEAKPLYEESLELYRSNLSTKVLDLANAIRPYALLNEAQGNLELARDLWEEARQLYRSVRVEVFPSAGYTSANLSAPQVRSHFFGPTPIVSVITLFEPFPSASETPRFTHPISTLRTRKIQGESRKPL